LQAPLPPHLHTPLTQLSPVLQACPQLPQLLMSLLKLAQPVEQHVSPALHTTPLHAHAPAEQCSGDWHCVVQLPQWLSSLETLAHALLQHSCVSEQGPLAQAHPLALQPVSQQTLPAAQAAPPGALVQLHAPATQVSPGLQAMPQPPQWKASFMTSTQPTPSQHDLPPVQPDPPRQRQAPPLQYSLVPQAVLQSPQCVASADGSMQPPPQQSSSLAQMRSPQRWSVMSSVTECPPPNVPICTIDVPIIVLGPNARAPITNGGGDSEIGGKSVKTNVGAGVNPSVASCVMSTEREPLPSTSRTS
jgi:hypothetical protein